MGLLQRENHQAAGQVLAWTKCHIDPEQGALREGREVMVLVLPLVQEPVSTVKDHAFRVVPKPKLA